MIGLWICLAMRDTYELMTYDIDTTSFVYEFNEDDIEQKLDINLNWLKEYKVLASLSNLEYERILLFHIVEGYQKEVKNKAEAYIEKLKQQFDDIDQYILRFEKDDNYMVIVSRNAKNIMDHLKERLIE